jgi:hypothetical protein
MNLSTSFLLRVRLCDDITRMNSEYHVKGVARFHELMSVLVYTIELFLYIYISVSVLFFVCLVSCLLLFRVWRCFVLFVFL